MFLFRLNAQVWMFLSKMILTVWCGCCSVSLPPIKDGLCLGVFVQAAPGGANKFENNSHSALCAVLGCPVFWPHISVVSVSKEEKRLL